MHRLQDSCRGVQGETRTQASFSCRTTKVYPPSESQWEGRSTYSWKELLDKQFNWPPHVHVTSVTRNCIIIEYSVLPFFAPAVVRDLTDPLVLAVLKRQGVTVKLSQKLIEIGKENIIPRNDVCKHISS